MVLIRKSRVPGTLKRKSSLSRPKVKKSAKPVKRVIVTTTRVSSRKNPSKPKIHKHVSIVTSSKPKGSRQKIIRPVSLRKTSKLRPVSISKRLPKRGVIVTKAKPGWSHISKHATKKDNRSVKIRKEKTVLPLLVTKKHHAGYHVVINCSGCSRKVTTNPSVIEAFSQKLVEHIGQIKRGQMIVRIANDSVTGKVKAIHAVQFLQSGGLLTVQTSTSHEKVFIDLQSPTEYRIHEVEAIIRKSFHPRSVKVHFMIRH